MKYPHLIGKVSGLSQMLVEYNREKFHPYADVLADRIDRRKIMYLTHFVRMGIVACLPFVTAAWQIYVLIFFLNIFNEFFTPAYKAPIPQAIKIKENYSSGIILSNATNQLLGVLGPGLAGATAAWLGARQIFFVDTASFIIAAVFILTLPFVLILNIRSGMPTSAIRQSRRTCIIIQIAILIRTR